MGAECNQEPLTEEEVQTQSEEDNGEESSSDAMPAYLLEAHDEDAEMAAMEAELQRLQKEQKKLTMQRQLQEMRAENAKLKSSLEQPATVGMQAASQGASATQMASSDQMRQMMAEQVEQLMYANPTTRAIAQAATSPHSAKADEQQGSQSQSRGKKNEKAILMPEDFAHRPGQSDLEFGHLSMSELVLGTIRIILNGDITEAEAKARLHHLAELMIQASVFRWPAVRALYGVALKEIRKEVRQWSDPLRDLKDEMLKPGDVLGLTLTKKPSYSSASSTPSSVCTQWNYSKDGCPRGADCEHRHICKECDRSRHREERHRAKTCPHKQTDAKTKKPADKEEKED